MDKADLTPQGVDRRTPNSWFNSNALTVVGSIGSVIGLGFGAISFARSSLTDSTEAALLVGVVAATVLLLFALLFRVIRSAERDRQLWVGEFERSSAALGLVEAQLDATRQELNTIQHRAAVVVNLRKCFKHVRDSYDRAWVDGPGSSSGAPAARESMKEAMDDLAQYYTELTGTFCWVTLRFTLDVQYQDEKGHPVAQPGLHTHLRSKGAPPEARSKHLLSDCPDFEALRKGDGRSGLFINNDLPSSYGSDGLRRFFEVGTQSVISWPIRSGSLPASKERAPAPGILGVVRVEAAKPRAFDDSPDSFDTQIGKCFAYAIPFYIQSWLAHELPLPGTEIELRDGKVTA